MADNARLNIFISLIFHEKYHHRKLHNFVVYDDVFHIHWVQAYVHFNIPSTYALKLDQS